MNKALCHNPVLYFHKTIPVRIWVVAMMPGSMNATVPGTRLQICANTKTYDTTQQHVQSALLDQMPIAV